MHSPRFTIYIPSHNKGKYLAEAIESVLRQSADNWELLLIDVGSTDTTQSVMRLYSGEPRIKAFTLEKTPLPAVCNFALAQSRGEYFIRLDGDDILEENILLVLGTYLHNHPEVALVFPDYYLVNEVGEILSLEMRQPIFHADHIMDQPPNGACTMIRSSVLRDIGGYREDLGAQDGLDIWSKLRKAGRLAANINLPLFYYRRHGSNLTNDSSHILRSQRGIRLEHGALALENCRPVIAAIPCRSHYDFAPDLWNCAFGAKSLLENKVDTCLEAGIFDKVLVYCDNPDAEKLLAGYDDPRLEFFLRDPRTTIRSVNLAMALRPLIQRYDPDFRGSTVVNYIQAPFVSAHTLGDACFSLASNEADASIGVDEVTLPLYRRSPQGLSPLRASASICSSHEKFFLETRSCMATRNRNIRDGSLTGARVTCFVMSPGEAHFIDSERNLAIARFLREMDTCASL